jgi:hypothetical protein
MRTIINQNRDPLELPDLRNLGTILRILLAVNGMVFVAALAGDTQWREISDAWVQMSAMVEGSYGALGLLPPTANLEHVDPEVPFDCLPVVARPADVSAALSNSFGFGGQNVSLVFQKPAHD